MKKPYRPALHPAVLLLALALWAGCDGSGDTLANLSGTVREADGQTPLADVRVELGGARTTTDEGGRFALRDVPVGPTVTLRATAAGFDAYTEAVVLSEGENVHDIVLARRTYYTVDAPSINIGVHLIPGVDADRAVVFFVPPVTVDARGFANGSQVTVPNPPSPQVPVLLNAHVVGLRERSLALAPEHGLALMGAETNEMGPAAFDAVLAALTQIADQSGHPELAQAPLLFVGHSWGGCFAYDFTRRHSGRVVGFMTQKGDCLGGGNVSPATLLVPAYLFIGELDPLSPPPADHSITRAFETNRANGALWALAVEPGAGHSPVTDLDLFARWMDAVLERRLPETPSPGSPVALNALDEASGWLGNRETFEIAAYDEYDGDPLQASWLPSMQTALDWQAFVTPGD